MKKLYVSFVLSEEANNNQIKSGVKVSIRINGTLEFSSQKSPHMLGIDLAQSKTN